MPKLSIIIPIYNAEHSLTRCIESILGQSYDDYELLLVNDGSIDSSLSICRYYAEIDNRVVVIDKQNGGASSARNFGLNEISGEWVTFIDSDDWIGDNYFAVLSDDPQVDLIVGSIFFNNDRTLGIIDKTDICFIGPELRTIIQEKYNHSLFNSPCAKFYRKKILLQNNIFFDESLVFGEDAVFVKMYLLHTTSLQTYNESIYYYDDIGDAIYEKYNESFLPIYDYYLKMSSIYIDLEKKYQIVLSKHELIGVIYNLVVQSIKKEKLKEWNIIHKFLNDNEVRVVLMQRESLHIKILLLLARGFNGGIFYHYFQLIEKLKYLLKRS